MDETIKKAKRAGVIIYSRLRVWGAGDALAPLKPNGKIFLWALLLIVGLSVLGEVFFRIDAVREALTGPRFGSRHIQLDQQFGRIEKLTREGEPIDCIFLGNSMMWWSVNPLEMNQIIQTQTGQEIHCFNFGVSALPASGAGWIAPLLVDKYQPKLLVYGTFARDYAIPRSAEDASVVFQSAWLQYQKGQFNLTGWLYDHSRFLQYKDHVRDAIVLNLDDVIPEYNGLPRHREYGFEPRSKMVQNVLQPPDLTNPVNRDPQRWLTNYKILNENLEGLRQIVRLSEQGVQVVVVEMAFHENGLVFFTNGMKDYEKYLLAVEQITRANKVPFVRIDNQLKIPDDGWWDYFHVTANGAEVFSEWLGNKLSKMILQREISIAPSAVK